MEDTNWNLHPHHRRVEVDAEKQELWAAKNSCRGTGDPGIRRSATELHRRSPPYPVTGIAPATSRLTGEVTRIFTTGKLKTIPYRGTTEQSIFEAAVLD